MLPVVQELVDSRAYVPGRPSMHPAGVDALVRVCNQRVCGHSEEEGRENVKGLQGAITVECVVVLGRVCQPSENISYCLRPWLPEPERDEVHLSK